MELYSSHTCFCLTSSSLCLLPSAAWHRISERETRPTGASVSSCWIGNLALTALKYEPLAGATSRIDPLCASWTGSRLSREVTVQLFGTGHKPKRRLSHSSHQYIPQRKHPSEGLHSNYYMSPGCNVR